MKNFKVILILYLVLMHCLYMFSQINYVLSDEGGTMFTKRIEYNFILGGVYNLRGKTDMEKRLLPDYNSMIEFYIRPSFSGAYSFCINKKDTTNNYLLEVKSITNWDEVKKKVITELPPKSTSSVTGVEKKEILMYNRRIFEARRKNAIVLYEVESDTCTISNNLSSLLYNTYVTLIDNYTAKGMATSVRDGISVTFRCVVKDEVWSFTIKTPHGKFGKLTEICIQIIEDVKAGVLNESKYISMLNNDVLN